MAAGLPALDQTPVDLLGGRRQGARRSRSPDTVREAGTYAILLLLATYGLRGREVAALTLDDIDWRRERLAIPERKAGHSTAFPLSGAAGQALADYLRHGRPDSTDRHVFFRAMAPVRPIGTDAVSGCARRYLLRARPRGAPPGPAKMPGLTTESSRRVSVTISLLPVGHHLGRQRCRRPGSGYGPHQRM